MRPSPKIAWIVGIVSAPVFISLLISLGSDDDDIDCPVRVHNFLLGSLFSVSRLTPDVEHAA